MWKYKSLEKPVYFLVLVQLLDNKTITDVSCSLCFLQVVPLLRRGKTIKYCCLLDTYLLRIKWSNEILNVMHFCVLSVLGVSIVFKGKCDWNGFTWCRWQTCCCHPHIIVIVVNFVFLNFVLFLFSIINYLIINIIQLL